MQYEKRVLTVGLISESQQGKVRGTGKNLHHESKVVLSLCTPWKNMRNGAVDPFILNIGQ
jgi:hypothetical protein